MKVLDTRVPSRSSGDSAPTPPPDSPSGFTRTSVLTGGLALVIFAILAFTAWEGTILAVALSAVTVAAIGRDRVVGVAAALSVALLVHYPSQIVEVKGRPVLLAGVAGLCALALVRGSGRRLNTPAVLLAGAYFAVTVLAHLLGETGTSTSTTIGIAAFAMAAAGLGSAATRDDLQVFAQVLVVIGLLESALGILVSPLQVDWAMRSISATNIDGAGTFVFVRQPNLILHGDFLRVSGSAGHPIPYSLFLLLVIALLASGAARLGWRTAVLLSAPLAAGIVLSGSRSTIAAGIFAASAMLLAMSPRRFRAARVPLLLVAGTAFYQYISFAVDNARTYSLSSLTHRVDAWRSLLGLLDRSAEEFLLGWGPASMDALQANGLVRFSVNLGTYDNQFVTTLALLGVTGLTVVLAVLARAFLLGSGPTRAVALTLGFMFLSFDAFAWLLFVFMFWFMLSMARDGRGGVTRSEAG